MNEKQLNPFIEEGNEEELDLKLNPFVDNEEN